MTGTSLLATEPIVRDFPWTGYHTFADIGPAAAWRRAGHGPDPSGLEPRSETVPPVQSVLSVERRRRIGCCTSPWLMTSVSRTFGLLMSLNLQIVPSGSVSATGLKCARGYAMRASEKPCCARWWKRSTVVWTMVAGLNW